MRIAVNICFAEPVAGIPIYYRLLLNQLVNSTPGHHFSFYTNHGFQFETASPVNVDVISLPLDEGYFPLKKTNWLRKLKQQILAGAPDLLINCDPFNSLSLPVPQLLLLDETAVELFADGLKWRPRRSLLRNLNLARTILIPSQFDEDRLMAALRLQPAKKEIIGTGPQLHALQLSWDQKEIVKERFSGGKEYFLVTPVRLRPDSIINLLKAFSLFKKRQHSNLQLMLPAKLVEQHPDFDQKLGTYKYREDVVILPKLPDREQLELLAAAYSLVDPTDHLFSNAMTLQAFESGIPVILPHRGRSKELVNPGEMLEADINQPQQLASQMMLLYKDEHLRKRLVDAGISSLTDNSWEKVVGKLQDVMDAVIRDS